MLNCCDVVLCCTAMRQYLILSAYGEIFVAFAILPIATHKGTKYDMINGLFQFRSDHFSSE